MPRFLLFRRIIAAARHPPGSAGLFDNEMISMVKATSLASVITLMEVTGVAAQADLRDLSGHRGLHRRRRHLPGHQLPADPPRPLLEYQSEPASAPAGRAPQRRQRRRYDDEPCPQQSATDRGPHVRDLHKSFGPARGAEGHLARRPGGRSHFASSAPPARANPRLLRCINLLETPDPARSPCRRRNDPDASCAQRQGRAGRPPAGGPHPLASAWCSRASICGPT